MSAQLKGRLHRLHCTLAAFAMLVSAAMVSLTATPAQAVNADQFAWPATGHTDANDVAWHRSNENGARAVDIQASTGTPVYAAQSGVVVMASAGCANSNSWGCGHGFGNYVIIRHDRPSVANPLYTLYGHLNRDNLSVSVNQFVSTGTRLGEIALSGTTTGGHTHFAIGTCSTPSSSGPSDYDTNCTVWNGSDTADGTVTKGDPVPGTYAELNGAGGGSSEFPCYRRCWVPYGDHT
jgi:murein DD-endopeptidase MepM/ murein hydrolase activator NlpD